MLESANPEVDVQALMDKVRAEVQRRQAAGTLPPAQQPSPYDALEFQVAEAIREAREKHQTDARYPAIVQRLLRDQGAVNTKLIHVVERLAGQLAVLRAGQKKLESEIATLKGEIVSQRQAEQAQRQAEQAQRQAEQAQRQAEQAQSQAGLRKLELEIAALKGEASLQRQSLSRLLDGLKLQSAGAAGTVVAAKMSETQRHNLDAFYLAFENRYRGSREEIKRRLAVYLPHVAQAGVGTAEKPVLDLGCGRGEWLELLKENGFTARGVDMNIPALAMCCELGLNVVESDVIVCLRSLPDRSLGMVTAFHIIEHLPLPMLLELMSELYRVLQEGGLVVLESPNPANIQVGACNFYLDPTHRRPLPVGLTEFITEHAGFTNVHVLYLQPHEAVSHVGPVDSPVAQRFNEYFYGAQDYAVIGTKPATIE